MRRATGITLVLLGGGVAVGMAASGGADAACRTARGQNRPEADRPCYSDARSGHGVYHRRGGDRAEHLRRSSDGHHRQGSDRGGFGRTASTHHASLGG